MLVLDDDRDAFYSFIRMHLTPTGIALICTMGDGNFEQQSDVENAFNIQDRIHEQTGKSSPNRKYLLPGCKLSNIQVRIG